MPDPDVQTPAAAWLALVDAGNAAASWNATAGAFQAAVTAERWAEQLGAARGPLGPLTSRSLAVEEQLDAIPGAPPGAYVVRQYHAVYDARKAVVETLTLVRESDDRWRVVGYFIR